MKKHTIVIWFRAFTSAIMAPPVLEFPTFPPKNGISLITQHTDHRIWLEIQPSTANQIRENYEWVEW